MKKHSGFHTRTGGFTFLAVLITIMVMGVMLGSVGQSWKQIMQREREEELLFRGLQIQEAISRWHQPKETGQHVATPLNDLKHLLQDPRTPATVRYLRKIYRDPLTNEDWRLIRDPARGIVGVASTSADTTIKRDNFPEQLQHFAGTERYDQWLFVYRQAALPQQPQANPANSPSGPAATPPQAR